MNSITLADISPGDRYKILAGLVVPRPIAWVATVNDEGVVNAAPFSFFNVFGSRPPIVAFAPGNREPGIPKDTAANIASNGEFVVHLVDEEHGPDMVATAAEFPPGESELDALELTTSPSQQIAPPRITEASVALECRHHQTLEIGSNRMVIGEVLVAHVREGLLDENYRLQTGSWAPIGRMASPDQYCRTTDQFGMS